MMELKRSERWILSSQYRILEALYPDRADEYREVREALERGDTALIDAHAAFLEADEPLLSEPDRALVDRILSMFDALQHSCRELEDPSGIDDPDQLLFQGFDVESEGDLDAYARRLLAETGRFAQVEGKEEPGSDRPMLPVYRRMLETWHIYSDARELTIVQILYILGAAAEPMHD